MTGRERVKLRLGKYKTPRFRYGRRIKDVVGNEYTIVGLHDAKIPWPVGKRGNSRSIVLCGDLVKAVRREPAVAIMHWWGVGASTVNRWRKTLGVQHDNAGTIELRRKHFDEPWGHKARKLAWAKARDPERRKKIAASRLGKPRPPHVIEAMRRAMTGKSLSAETRRKMSEAHKRRGTRPPKAGRPWTAEEDKLCRLLRLAEVVRRTGRSVSAVKWRRRLLGLPDGRRRENKAKAVTH